MKEKIKKMYAWGRINILSPLEKYALTLFERRKLETWMLMQLFPDLVEYNEEFLFFIIYNFPMPGNIKQRYSRLLFELPISEKQEESFPNQCPSSFYLDCELQDLNGNYIIDELRGLEQNWELFNDRLNEGYGRFILPVKKWQPTWDIISGDNLVTLVQNIALTISQLGRK